MFRMQWAEYNVRILQADGSRARENYVLGSVGGNVAERSRYEGGIKRLMGGGR